MKKRAGLFFLLTLITLFVTSLPVFADDKTPANEFRVGMEAGYAPFNWTQTNDKHGAVEIAGQKNAMSVMCRLSQLHRCWIL